MKKVLNSFLIIILLLILTTLIYLKFIKKEELINLCGKSVLIVTTGSMEPNINLGELIIISKEDNYNIGDIVTFCDNGVLVTHRIIELDNEYMITKGDKNNLKDNKVSMKNIKGKVIYHSELLGWFVLYMLKPLIIAYSITLILTNLINILINKKGETCNEKI